MMFILFTSEAVHATSSQCMENWLQRNDRLLRQNSIVANEYFPTIAVAYIRFSSMLTPLYTYDRANPTYNLFAKLPILYPTDPVGTAIITQMIHCGCTFGNDLYGMYHISMLCARGA
jgi:hypothetical protein